MSPTPWLNCCTKIPSPRALILIPTLDVPCSILPRNSPPHCTTFLQAKATAFSIHTPRPAVQDRARHAPSGCTVWQQLLAGISKGTELTAFAADWGANAPCGKGRARCFPGAWESLLAQMDHNESDYLWPHRVCPFTVALGTDCRASCPPAATS